MTKIKDYEHRTRAEILSDQPANPATPRPPHRFAQAPAGSEALADNLRIRYFSRESRWMHFLLHRFDEREAAAVIFDAWDGNPPNRDGDVYEAVRHKLRDPLRKYKERVLKKMLVSYNSSPS